VDHDHTPNGVVARQVALPNLDALDRKAHSLIGSDPPELSAASRDPEAGVVQAPPEPGGRRARFSAIASLVLFVIEHL
jgi:hypothetical protein